jgi:glycine/serine hydroxymethyltransferase
MGTDEGHTEEWTKVMAQRAQLAAVLDASGVTPNGQAVAAIMTAARCVGRAQMPHGAHLCHACRLRDPRRAAMNCGMQLCVAIHSCT